VRVDRRIGISDTLFKPYPTLDALGRLKLTMFECTDSFVRVPTIDGGRNWVCIRNWSIEVRSTNVFTIS
jgi:hypothetical protein